MGKEAFDKGIRTEILMDWVGEGKFQFFLVTSKGHSELCNSFNLQNYLVGVGICFSISLHLKTHRVIKRNLDYL